MRALLVLVAACAALAVAAPAAAADRVVERGIVQSVGPSGVVLRALDGTDVTVPVGPGTRYRLNGRLATLDAIQRGFVAEAVSDGAGPALMIRAFGSVAGREEIGRLVRVRPRALVLRRGPGDTARIALTARTTIWRGSSRARIGALRPGMRVQVVLAANGSARVIVVQSGA